MSSVVIATRFRGPATSGNGGYSCGVVAQLVGGPADVMLRRPPPLEKPLTVEHRDGIVLLDGDVLVAEGKPAVVDLEVPAAPSFEEAEKKSRYYIGFENHFFPECFVCGPKRGVGDGLRIFPGREPGEALVAAPWTPHESMIDASGKVDPRIVWASLDCPGYFALGKGETAVIGKMTGEVKGTVRPGERCVVIGWGLGQEGRKLFTATALFSESGELVGRSRQVWIKIAS